MTQDDETQHDRTRTRSFDAPVGRIVGRVEGEVVRALGIPYATAARFEPPRPAPDVVDEHGEPAPYEAFERSPGSPQLPSPVLETLMEGLNDGIVFSEDCQALSITTPADLAPGERLPVMVWIHGGSYVTGAGDQDVYDPRHLVAEQRVVVVNVTYRLGMLGFFGDGKDVPANLGLLDLLAALRWIRDNIAAFGGAPDAVTLFGQSAGGDAIAHLMIAEGAEGLFRRAIIQSAPLGIGSGRSAMTTAMATAVGTPSRTAPVADIVAQQGVAERAAKRFGLRGGMAFGTQYGFAPLPAEEDRDAAWRAVAPAIDVLIGSTIDEAALYLPFLPGARRITELPVVGGFLRRLLVRIPTRVVYTKDAARFAERHRAAGGRATVYELQWAPDDSALGAAHTTDIPLLLGTHEAWARTTIVGEHNWPEIAERAKALRFVWAEFARTGGVSPSAAAVGIGTITIDRG